MADPGRSASRLIKPTVAAATLAATLAGSGTLLTSAAKQPEQVSLNWAYTVHRGDTLSHISPTAWQAVAHENALRDPNRIYVGQFLYVDVKQVAPGLRQTLITRATLLYLQRAGFHSHPKHPAAPKPAPKPVAKPAPPPSSTSGTSPTSPSKGINNQPPTSGGNLGGSGSSSVAYCRTAVDFSNAAQWAVPHGCYGTIYYPNPASMPARPGFGWCNWLPEEAHLNYVGSSVLGLTKHWGAPRVGAVVWFNPGVQGAGGAGHWANLVAIGPNGWGLVEEMNFSWRGGGFGRVDYRFIRLYTPGLAYLYA
ncbi:MAG: LysM peptidoglycan-binding domain-containing protein [Ktedonobacterales bacterium]